MTTAICAAAVVVAPLAAVRAERAAAPGEAAQLGVRPTAPAAARKVKLALEAEQEATTSAVTLPELSTAMFETVTPFTVADALPLTVTVNEAGGCAYKLPPKSALAQFAATGCLNATFYASAEDQLVLQGLENVAGRRSFHLSDVVYTVGTLRAGGVDWDYVTKTARTHGVDAGLSCYLSYVDDIHRRVLGRPLLPSEIKRTLRIDGWGRVDFQNGAFHFPAFRVSGRLYAHQLVANVRSGGWRSAGRLCLLPFVAGAALARRVVWPRARQ